MMWTLKRPLMLLLQCSGDLDVQHHDKWEQRRSLQIPISGGVGERAGGRGF